MASSNRHWPSLFKSKPCTAHPHHQWQHDINHSSLLSPGACQKPSYTSGLRSTEERSPEPKPRWNPKPEQIRILEAIFNSGMVNPPRDEIRRIRAQLQEYGQVGDANVFYWFQNRKSRSKHKQRNLQSTARHHHQSRAASASAPPPPQAPHVPLAAAAATSSSSSSSERSTGSDKILPMVSVRFPGMVEAAVVAAAPTCSFNQNYLQGPAEFLVEPVYLQGGQGFCLSSAGELPGVVAVQEPGIRLVPGLWTELMMGQEGVKGTTGGVEVSKIGAKMQNPNPNNSSGVVAAAGASAIASTTTAAAATSVETVTGPIHEIQGGAGVGGVGGGAARSTVFINGVGFEVVAGFLNVWEVFGKEAVLVHAAGHPVLTDDWGLTLHPLQDGASYFLI